MSCSSSLSGLGRGRAHGRRDIAEDEQPAERRPGRFRVEDWEGELAGTQSDGESKWITMTYNAPSPYVGYILHMHQAQMLKRQGSLGLRTRRRSRRRAQDL